MSEHEQGVFNVVALDLEKASVDIYTHVYDWNQLLSLPYFDDT